MDYALLRRGRSSGETESNLQMKRIGGGRKSIVRLSQLRVSKLGSETQIRADRTKGSSAWPEKEKKGVQKELGGK